MVGYRIITMRLLILFLIFLFSFQQSTWGENVLTEFLVAKPYMPDPRFKETVIVMLYHNQEEGAAGLVLNKPIKTISISELFEMISEILKQKLDIKYIDASKKNSHYALTPYEFSPTYGKKIVPEQYIDLGQGLLKLIENIDQDVKIKK